MKIERCQRLFKFALEIACVSAKQLQIKIMRDKCERNKGVEHIFWNIKQFCKYSREQVHGNTFKTNVGTVKRVNLSLALLKNQYYCNFVTISAVIVVTENMMCHSGHMWSTTNGIYFYRRVL